MARLTENFSTFQYEVYLEGLAGRTPDLPFDVDGLRAAAHERMSAEAIGYVDGSAGSEDTEAENRRAFGRWRLEPRMLRDVSQREVATTVVGTELTAPVLLAPVGVLGIVHDEGERAVARAAADVGVGMCLSTASSSTLEDVADDLGDTPRWFQLYWPKDDDLTRSLLQRAEAAGYSAVVVTLDTWLLGWRPRDLQRAYLPFLQGLGIANYLSDPVFRSRLDAPPEEDLQGAVMQWVATFSDPSHTWEQLAFLQRCTDLPIVLKGVLHPDDARRAVDAGVQGLVVSNHGGRQVDGAVASLDALPRVVDAVGEQLDVLLDSGVRSGPDAVKALALGAKAVMLGRPYVWGLGARGEDGVRHVLRSFIADLDLAMALSGHPRLSDLSRDSLVRPLAHGTEQ